MSTLKAIWELMRLEHGVMLALGIFIGSLIASQGENFPPISNFVLTFFTALFLEASTFALNDYFDVEIDKKNNRLDRPLARGDLSPQVALYLFLVLFPLGIICSYFVNFTCFLIALITAVFAIFYDVYLKKIKFLSNFYIAYVMAIPFVFGAAAVPTPQTSTAIDPGVLVIAAIAFLAGSGREIMKDVMDFEGDQAGGVKSFPKYIGIKKSNIIASSFYVLAVILSFLPFFSEDFPLYQSNLVFLGFVLITDFLLLFTSFQLLFNEEIDMSVYRKISLSAIFIGLLGFFLGAFIG